MSIEICKGAGGGRGRRGEVSPFISQRAKESEKEMEKGVTYTVGVISSQSNVAFLPVLMVGIVATYHNHGKNDQDANKHIYANFVVSRSAAILIRGRIILWDIHTASEDIPFQYIDVTLRQVCEHDW